MPPSKAGDWWLKIQPPNFGGSLPFFELSETLQVQMLRRIDEAALTRIVTPLVVLRTKHTSRLAGEPPDLSATPFVLVALKDEQWGGPDGEVC